jgi:hypothetical protein
MEKLTFLFPLGLAIDFLINHKSKYFIHKKEQYGQHKLLNYKNFPKFVILSWPTHIVELLKNSKICDNFLILY